MKYLVVEIQKSKNGTVSNIVTAYDTVNEAESKYHTVLAAAAVSGLPAHSAVILNEAGYPYKHEGYIRSEDE